MKHPQAEGTSRLRFSNLFISGQGGLAIRMSKNAWNDTSPAPVAGPDWTSHPEIALTCQPAASNGARFKLNSSSSLAQTSTPPKSMLPSRRYTKHHRRHPSIFSYKIPPQQKSHLRVFRSQPDGARLLPRTSSSPRCTSPFRPRASIPFFSARNPCTTKSPCLDRSP